MAVGKNYDGSKIAPYLDKETNTITTTKAWLGLHAKDKSADAEKALTRQLVSWSICPPCYTFNNTEEVRRILGIDPPDAQVAAAALPFPPGSRVLYVPSHAAGDTSHKDCEAGIVSSANAGRVFVQFDKAIRSQGFDGAQSQACDPGDLILLPDFPFDQAPADPADEADGDQVDI